MSYLSQSHELYSPNRPCSTPAEAMYSYPVLKEKKDATPLTNYRRITVLSIIGKVSERVLQIRTKTQIEAQQSKMQMGFTINSSAVNAALIITEAQNEGRDIGEPLTLVTLGACKMFDVAWQESLLRKI